MMAPIMAAPPAMAPHLMGGHGGGLSPLVECVKTGQRPISRPTKVVVFFSASERFYLSSKG